MHKIRHGVLFSALLCFGLAAPAGLRAQQFNEGAFEVSVGLGLSGGLGSVDQIADVGGLIEDLEDLLDNEVTFDPGSNSKWNFGVSGGYGFRPNLILTGEIVRTRLLNPSLIVGAPPIATFDFNASLVEATVGLQYQIPLPDRNTAPYVAAGLGYARSSVSLQDSSFSVLSMNLSGNHFTGHLGGGARVYFGENWGIRPELKVVFIPDESWVRTSVGLFYQFGN